jgi:hypothetical protein
MASLYDKVKKDMNSAGIRPRTQTAQNWLASKVRQLKIPASRVNLLNDPSRATGFAIVGKMFFYHYDPKTKDTLPVYDKFPLVIPMELYPDGFLALNLHYLDPYTRLYLLDLLHDFINNTKYDDTTRFKLSYQLLSSSKRYRVIEPCIKRYLYSHIRSSMIYIEPESWDTAIFLPSAKMVYKS